MISGILDGVGYGLVQYCPQLHIITEISGLDQPFIRAMNVVAEGIQSSCNSRFVCTKEESQETARESLVDLE